MFVAYQLLLLTFYLLISTTDKCYLKCSCNNLAFRKLCVDTYLINYQKHLLYAPRTFCIISQRHAKNSIILNGHNFTYLTFLKNAFNYVDVRKRLMQMKTYIAVRLFKRLQWVFVASSTFRQRKARTRSHDSRARKYDAKA